MYGLLLLLLLNHNVFHFQFFSSQSEANLSSLFVVSLKLESRNRQHLLYAVMNQNLGQHDYSEIKLDDKISMRETNNCKKSHKCNQCNFASSWTNNLRKHMKAHSGEKSNTCNQCDYASSRADSLRRHLESGVEKRQTNAICVAMGPFVQAV